MTKYTSLIIIFFLLLLLPVGSATAYEFNPGQMDDTIDVPDRTITEPKDLEVTPVEVTHVTRIDQGDDITVKADVSEPSGVELRDPKGGVKGLGGTVKSSDGTHTFETESSWKGSWRVVLTHNGNKEDLHPVIITKYDVSLNRPSTTVTQGTPVTAEISLSGGTSQQVPTVKAVLVRSDGDSRKRVTATHDNGNTYSVSIPTNDLDAGDYKLAGTVVEEGEAQRGKDNVIGYSDLTSINIESKDNNDEEDTNDDENTESSDGGGGGQSAGGQGAGGQAGGGTGSADSGPPDVADVKSTLNLVDPARKTTLKANPADSETQATQQSESSDDQSSNSDTETRVKSVSFSGDSETSVSVTNYGEPPQTLEEEVVNSIAANHPDIQPATQPSDAETTDTGSDQASETQSTTQSNSVKLDGSETASIADSEQSPQASKETSSDSEPTSQSRIDILSISDITPQTEIEDASTTAEVTLTVDADAVSNPSQLTVYKEEYIFEAQEEQWIELDPTTIQETNDNISLIVETDEFSLFALAEVTNPATSSDTNNNKTENQTQSQTEDQSDQSGDTQRRDTAPGFGLLASLIGICLALLVTMRKER